MWLQGGRLTPIRALPTERRDAENDEDIMTRTASFAVITTANLDNVFRVSLSHCDRCCPQTELILDPDGFTHEGLAAVIAKRFVQWCERKKTARKPDESRSTVFA